jgi:hypothetical protein
MEWKNPLRLLKVPPWNWRTPLRVHKIRPWNIRTHQDYVKIF